MSNSVFSDQLEEWLNSNNKKTFNGLMTVFAERSFAITILLLMSVPALPLPTGGVTHLFEIIVMLLSLEMIVGRRTIWLPKRWLHIRLGETLQGKAIPFIIKRVRWFERFSRPRLKYVIDHGIFTRLAGIIILIFSVFAFIAPPFSFLDTLPALGAVVVALSLILSDIVMFLLGTLIGSIGLTLVITLGSATFRLL